MSDVKAKGKKYLEKMFPLGNVKETDTGFKFNLPELNTQDVYRLNKVLTKYHNLHIKRSGTGLVIIIHF